MVLFDNGERNVLIGIGIGLATATVGKGLFPIVGTLGRPLLKAAVKASLLAYDKGMEVSGHLRETIEDLAAEARAELDAEAARDAMGGDEPPSPDDKVS